MTRRYWKTTATTTILTEDDAPPVYGEMGGALEEIAYDITFGHASGVTKYAHEEVTEEQMRALLLEQGTDPDFLLGDDLNQEDDEDDDDEMRHPGLTSGRGQS